MSVVFNSFFVCVMTQINDENDEKLPIGSVVGKLNVGIKALSDDIKNMNDQLSELQMKFKRGEVSSD